MMLEEIELLSQLTIIIPTYNRPQELERAIDYWSNTPVTLHILDGSLKPRFEQGILSDTTSIYYHHMPALPLESPPLNAYRRLLFSASLPHTNYSAVGCDDDFYTISGLVESIKYLQSHNNFDAVVGSEFHYRRKNNNLVWNFHRGHKRESKELETSSIEKKIQIKSSWYLYAVCRTPLWRKYLEICFEERGFSHHQYLGHEWLMHYLSKAMFKTKRLDMISLVRQHLIQGANIEPEVSWAEWLIDSDNNRLVDEIVEQLAKGFNLVTSPADTAKNLVLARSLISKEQARTCTDSSRSKNFTQAVRSISSKLLFKIMPNLKMFSDRPQKINNCWEMLEAKDLGSHRSELEYINRLLLTSTKEVDSR